MTEFLPDESSHSTTGGFVFYIFISVIVAYVINLAVKRRKMVNLINKIPGPPCWPFIGNTLEFNIDNEKLFHKMTSELCTYGDGISRVWIGRSPYCLLYKAKTAEVILGSQKHIEKADDYNLLHDWLGTGLLTASGSKWFSRRKMLTPAFHFKILEDFNEVFNQQSAKFVSKLEKHVDGKPFDIFSYITLLTLDVIMETAMGRNVNTQDHANSEYLNAVYREGKLFQQRMAKPWLKPNLGLKLWNYEKEHRQSIKVMHTFSMDTIQKRKKEYKNKQSANIDNKQEEILGKKTRLAFLDLLIENSDDGRILSDEDIRDEVDTFVFEGHDTTAAGISFAVFLLACHPECQKLVHEELDAIFGDSDRPATMDDIREMKYLECCIKEAQRIYPSVPFIMRNLKQEVNIDGYVLPAGTTTVIVIHRILRDPDQFPDPERFDPDRFLPQNSTKRHAYSYVPFSAGPRNCIGQRFAIMEEKVVLSSVFRKFRMESVEKQNEMRILGEMISRPVSGKIEVKLFKRTK